jgi:hypothetical protein
MIDTLTFVAHVSYPLKVSMSTMCLTLCKLVCQACVLPSECLCVAHVSYPLKVSVST